MAAMIEACEGACTQIEVTMEEEERTYIVVTNRLHVYPSVVYTRDYPGYLFASHHHHRYAARYDVSRKSGIFHRHVYTSKTHRSTSHIMSSARATML
jgi:hypothetical protein